MTLDHATSVHSAVDKLADQPYGTRALDSGLPDAQELEALNSLVGAAPDLPLVILTGTENEVLALQAVKGGAQDYLIKGQARRSSWSARSGMPSNASSRTAYPASRLLRPARHSSPTGGC